MTEKEKLIKELVQNNPKVSATKLYDTKIKGSKTLGKRKSDFLKIVREIRKLPEPSKQKRERSVPIKHRPTKRKPIKRVVSKPKTKLKEIKELKETLEVKEPKVFKKLKVKEQELLTRGLTPRQEAKLTDKLNVKERELLLKEQVESKQKRFEKSKFGSITNQLKKKHGINELKAIKRTRALLKIPKKDYKKLNRKDREVLSQFGY